MMIGTDLREQGALKFCGGKPVHCVPGATCAALRQRSGWRAWPMMWPARLRASERKYVLQSEALHNQPSVLYAFKGNARHPCASLALHSGSMVKVEPVAADESRSWWLSLSGVADGEDVVWSIELAGGADEAHLYHRVIWVRVRHGLMQNCVRRLSCLDQELAHGIETRQRDVPYRATSTSLCSSHSAWHAGSGVPVHVEGRGSALLDEPCVERRDSPQLAAKKLSVPSLSSKRLSEGLWASVEAQYNALLASLDAYARSAMNLTDGIDLDALSVATSCASSPLLGPLHRSLPYESEWTSTTEQQRASRRSLEHLLEGYTVRPLNHAAPTVALPDRASRHLYLEGVAGRLSFESAADCSSPGASDCSPLDVSRASPGPRSKSPGRHG